MRVSTPAGSPELNSSAYIETFKLALLVKYAALSGVILVDLAIDGYEAGLADVRSQLTTLVTISFLTSVPVMVALLFWVGSDRAIYGYAVMAAIGADAVVKMVRQGPYFLNHYFLQAIIGVVGLLAVARVASGDRTRDAWRPMAWLTILLWGAAAAKKFLHGTFVSGEYIASTVATVRRAPIGWFSDLLLVRNGDPSVPERCCVSGSIDVSTIAAAAVVLLGIGMALAELSPVAFVLWRRGRAYVGWVMLGTTVVATAATNEPDFGLTNVALVTLWAETRALRRTCIVIALGMAGILLWELLT